MKTLVQLILNEKHFERVQEIFNHEFPITNIDLEVTVDNILKAPLNQDQEMITYETLKVINFYDSEEQFTDVDYSELTKNQQTDIEYFLSYYYNNDIQAEVDKIVVQF